MPNQTIKDRSAKIPRGKTFLCDPVLNKGMAFNEAERDSSRARRFAPAANFLSRRTGSPCNR